MWYESAQISLRGNRATNQDRCAALGLNGAVLLLLADGVGGHPRGDVAAQILLETGQEHFLEATHPIADPQQFLHGLLTETQKRILTYGKQQQPPVDPRTTAVVALVQGQKAHWAHIGDSRCYLFRGGLVVTRTRDHTHVEELFQKGHLEASQLASHPLRGHVTRCLGGTRKFVHPNLSEANRLEVGDLLLLCSDGLWSQLQLEDMASELKRPIPLPELLADLARQAQQAGAPRSDNVSIAAFHLQESPPEAPAEAHTSMSDQEVDAAIGELKQAIQTFTKEIDGE